MLLLHLRHSDNRYYLNLKKKSVGSLLFILAYKFFLHAQQVFNLSDSFVFEIMTASARRQGQNQDRQISQQKIVNTLAHVRAEQQKEEHNQKVQ